MGKILVTLDCFKKTSIITPFELVIASPHLFPLGLPTLEPLHCDALHFSIYSRYNRRVDPSIGSLYIHLNFNSVSKILIAMDGNGNKYIHNDINILSKMAGGK